MDFYIKVSNGCRIHVGHTCHDMLDEAYFSLDDSCELATFMDLVTGRQMSVIPHRYLEMSKVLDLHGKNLVFAMPREALTERVQQCIQEICDVLIDPENAQYMITHVSNRRFLNNMRRAKINERSIKELMATTSNPTTLKSLTSLLPNEDGYCKPVKYDASGTATGRLTVTSGPRILTVPVAARDCLVSEYRGGSIIQIDIVSAEPKFALHVKGVKPPYDVYDHVASTILNGDIERHHAKLITLCALYGQSPKKLSQKLPSGVNVNEVISKTKEYFGISELIRTLKKGYEMSNLRNALGRPLHLNSSSDHLLVSHYLQSSIAEASILMFKSFVNEYSSDCEPLFVIHDALLIDAQPHFAKELLHKKNVRLELGNWIFDATIKLVSDS